MKNKYVAQDLNDLNIKLQNKINSSNIFIVPTYKLAEKIKPKNASLYYFRKIDEQVNSGARYNLIYLGNVVSINTENKTSKMPDLKEITTTKRINYLHEIDKKPLNNEIYTKAKDILDINTYLEQIDKDTLNNLEIEIKEEYTIFEVAKIYRKIERLNKRNLKVLENNTKKKVLKNVA